MNKQVFKRGALIVLMLVLSVTMIFSSNPGMGQVTATAANYIQQLSGNIVTGIEKHFDPSVMYKLPAGVKDDEIISVIINTGDDAIIDLYNGSSKTLSFSEFAFTDEATAVKEATRADKAEFLALLDEKGIEYTAGIEYSVVLSGFEIIIKAGDFDAVTASLGKGESAIVCEVFEAAETEIVENEVQFDDRTGIFDSTDFKFDGEGMLVAVLDTGLDYTHSAFSPNNFTSGKLGLTKDQVAALIGDTTAITRVPGITADDVYVNDKVPFAFDYADNDTDVYSLHNEHGTHVSGVIVGNDDTIRGVAPNAQLVSMKVFSDIQETARQSWIVAALEDCAVLGVDVINMSLGSSAGFSRELDIEALAEVHEKLSSLGISVVCAASNSYNSAFSSEKNGNLGLTSNPDTSTVGSPSSYQNSLSVASINGVRTPYILYNGRIIYFNEANNAAIKENDFVDKILPEGVDEAEFEFVLVPGAGREADYMGLDLTGKIALVKRGSNTFQEKADAAQKHGAAGMILFNNVSGDIKMNIGNATLPCCSITQEDGEVLAALDNGKVKISRGQTAGPFISDFSSWGPTPDLGIKPEITAHGGNILSAITGGGYDRLSGTSMACPNTAGLVILLRQYVTEKFPELADQPIAINAMVNRLLMSTATIALNKNGLPYAVRKQGAGLASLSGASETTAYILTYDRYDGSAMDKTKIELGDDPAKTGVYTLKFSVVNFGSGSLSYDVSALVMTEGVSETKTHKGETTVTENGYELKGATVEFTVSSNGTKDGNNITVPAGQTVDVNLTITLTEENKKYLDESFENGMYVEGFVKLEATAGTEIDLNAPYLAFYGDWTVAPMFDLEYFETNADELDDSIETLDKNLPDAYATRPVGGVYDDYINYLGSYYFIQDPSSKIISASKDYIAISNQDKTIHSLRFVWAGMLRNATKVEITITDDTTGEIVYETVDYSIRKSHGDGGPIRPANIDIEFDAAEHNLKNNTRYTVRLVGYLDYKDGGIETNENNVFEFPLVTDFEAPSLTDCEFYTEYDKDLKKNRLFARMAIYDNHYTMGMQVGCVTIGPDPETGEEAYLINTFDQYVTPVYSVRNGTTYVEYELTDHVYDIKNNNTDRPNTFVVTCYDYALNDATYEISLPNEFTDFYFEEYNPEADFDIAISPNEVYTLNPLIYPNTEWGEMLDYSTSNEDVAVVVKNKLVAVGSGFAKVYVKDPNSGKTAELRVKVYAESEEGYRLFDKPVAESFTVDGYQTLKAFYIMNTDDRDIGLTNDNRVFAGNYSLSLYPSESVKLKYTLDAYFPDATEVVFESGNQKIVTIDDKGVITAVNEGFAAVSINVKMDGMSTYYSQTISIEVKNPFVTAAPGLGNYYGAGDDNGGTVIIPDNLMITEIGMYAFSNYEYVLKDENDEISEEDPNFTKPMYIGNHDIKKVVIPEGVEKINPYAFANCTNLEEIVLPSTIEAIEYGAFYGCKSLKRIVGIEKVQLINKEAFYGCDLGGTISLDSARAVGDAAFAGNESLEAVILPATLQSIGASAFYGNKSLESVEVKADKVKYGAYVFAECDSLTEIRMNANVIPAGAFFGCDKLESVIIGKDVLTIGEHALAGTDIKTFTVEEGNVAFKDQTNKTYLLSADGSTLLLVAPGVNGEFKLDGVSKIGRGAFSSAIMISSVIMKDVTSVAEYAFADCSRIKSITLGKLTEIGEYSFSGTGITEMPDVSGVEFIGKYAFSKSEIKSVKIPDGVKVGEGAFYQCEKLTSVEIGNGVEIGMGAFMTDRANTTDALTLVPGSTVSNKAYYVKYSSPLTSLTIGKDVIIGESAFFGAANLKSVTLKSDGIVIGEQAFYNACALESFDFTKVKSIGKLAFSGDARNTYTDMMGQNLAIRDGAYFIYYYAPAFKSIDLSNVESIDEMAFMYCRSMTSVTLGDSIKEIPANAFYQCEKLNEINLDKVEKISDYAFTMTALEKVNLPLVTEIGEYAFASCEKMTELTLGVDGTDLGEGAFANNKALSKIENLGKSKNIGAYAFAYTAVTSADLTAAETVGDFAFMKDSLTEFTVTLGNALVSVGDNPFAFCKIKPFSVKVTETFNGKDYVTDSYTFDISDTVKVVDGSLYCKVDNGGYELIIFAGVDNKNVVVADGTVRITAMAFAGSDVEQVTLPYTVAAIGHKAFYGCEKLALVVFTSYEAPILEEEFDPSYYESLDNLPCTGDYDVILPNGKVETKKGTGLIPFYMWNMVGGKYNNVFYGANFIDYIGKVDNYVMMVRPSNGVYYDTFILDQYFSQSVKGSAAADDITLAAIAAINALPDVVKLEHEALVVAARQAYDKIATKEQQALVGSLYIKLESAELRIEALKPIEDPDQPDNPDQPETPDNKEESTAGFDAKLVIIIAEAAVIVILAAFLALTVFATKKAKKDNGDREEKTETVEEAEKTETEEETDTPQDADNE